MFHQNSQAMPLSWCFYALFQGNHDHKTSCQIFIHHLNNMVICLCQVKHIYPKGWSSLQETHWTNVVIEHYATRKLKLISWKSDQLRIYLFQRHDKMKNNIWSKFLPVFRIVTFSTVGFLSGGNYTKWSNSNHLY